MLIKREDLFFKLNDGYVGGLDVVSVVYDCRNKVMIFLVMW